MKCQRIGRSPTRFKVGRIEVMRHTSPDYLTLSLFWSWCVGGRFSTLATAPVAVATVDLLERLGELGAFRRPHSDAGACDALLRVRYLADAAHDSVSGPPS